MSGVPLDVVVQIANERGRLRMRLDGAVEVLQRIDRANGCACALPYVRAFLALYEKQGQ